MFLHTHNIVFYIYRCGCILQFHLFYLRTDICWPWLFFVHSVSFSLLLIAIFWLRSAIQQLPQFDDDVQVFVGLDENLRIGFFQNFLEEPVRQRDRLTNGRGRKSVSGVRWKSLRPRVREIVIWETAKLVNSS